MVNEIIRRKRITEEEVANIAKQLISATKYYHENGIFHGNLKLDKIFVDSISEDGKINIKISDFGLSVFFPIEEIKKNSTYYISPELLTKNHNEKCDMWSIGVILFVLLSGTVPFDGNSDDDIFQSIKVGKFDFHSIT